jgi:hypothetical protein
MAGLIMVCLRFVDEGVDRLPMAALLLALT